MVYGQKTRMIFITCKIGSILYKNMNLNHTIEITKFDNVYELLKLFS